MHPARNGHMLCTKSGLTNCRSSPYCCSGASQQLTKDRRHGGADIVMQRPDLVRKLVLVGTGPRNGDSMEDLTPEAQAIFGRACTPPMDQWLDVLFSPTPTSQAAGREFLHRIASRTENRDKVPAQVAAVMEWERTRRRSSLRAPSRCERIRALPSMPWGTASMNRWSHSFQASGTIRKCCYSNATHFSL
jgi:pimeloyl-ACP methyl ester carboxylesterase